MMPINNERNGFNENEKRNNLNLDNENQEVEGKAEESPQNSIAGNAAGNLPPEEIEDSEDESANDTDGKGFMGDFAKPQHDD